MSQPYNYYVGDGSTVAFEFTQPLSTKSTVVGLVDYVSQAGTWDSGTGFFTFTSAPVSGTKVHILRSTDDAAMEITFPNKSYIPDGALDKNWNQTRYMVEEIRFNDTLVNLNLGSGYWKQAKSWATETEDTLIPTAYGGNGTTDYSSLHWAAKSSASATASAASAAAALASESAAALSETNASNSETNAAASESAAATSASNASTSETNAAASASAAATSETNAATSADEAAASAVQAQVDAVAYAIALGG